MGRFHLKNANVIKQKGLILKKKQVQAVKSPDLAPSDYYLFRNLKSHFVLMMIKLKGACYRGLVWGPNTHLFFQRHRLLKKVGLMN